MSGYLQTCGMCGHTGPVRYDNRKNRRCENCWERVEMPVETPTPDLGAMKGDATTTIALVVEAEQAPAKPKKGK